MTTQKFGNSTSPIVNVDATITDGHRPEVVIHGGSAGTSDSLFPGTKSLTTTAAAISTSQAVSEVIVQNDPDNTVDILIGDSTAQVIQLAPRDSIVIPVADLATLYAKTVSGTATLNFLGRS
jgi:hypothetical protein